MRGNSTAAEQLDRHAALELAQVQLDVLHEARQVGDDEDASRRSCSRTKASTLRLSGCRNSSVPRPNAL